MSFFFNFRKAYSIMDSWLSWMMPANFLARSWRKFLFTIEKQNSTAFRFGEYGTLKIQRMPCCFILSFDRSEVWDDKLSIKIQILSSGFAALSPSTYSWNLSTLTDF